MGTKIGTAYVDVELRGDSLNGQVRKMGGQMEGQMTAAGTSARKGFLTPLKGMAAGILAGIGFDVVKDAVVDVTGSASDLNEEVNKTSVVFGKSSKSVLAWSKTSAERLGLSRSQALGAAGAYGNMFKTIGLGDKPAADMSKRFVGLAADMASFHNADPSEMLDKLRSGLSGEAEPLRQYGVLLSEASVKQFAYKHGIADVGSELTEQQKVQARYGVILEQTGKAQGDLARTSDSYANKQRRLTAELENAKARIGQALLPVMTKLADVLGDNLPGALRLVEQGFKAAQPYVEQLKTAFANLAPALSGLRDLWTALRPVIEVIMGHFKIMATLYINTLANALKILTGVLNVVIGVLTGDWSRAWTGVKQIFDGLTSYITDIGKAILGEVTNLTGPLFDAAKSVGSAIVDGVVSGVQSVAGKVAGWLAHIPGAVRGFVAQVTAAGKAIGEAVIAGVVSGITGIAEKVAGFVDNIPARVRAFIGAVTAAGKAVGAGIKDGVVNGITGIGQRAADFVDNIPGAVRAFINVVTSAGKAVGSAVKDGVVNGITGIAGSVGGYIDNIPGKVREYVSAVTSAGKEIGSAIAGAIISGIGDIGGRIGSKIRSGVTGALSGIPGKVKSFLHLARGGYIAGPTLAVVGEGRHPEYVLPEPMLNEALERAAGGGAGGVGEVRVYIGDTELRDIVRVVQQEREVDLTRAVQVGRR